MSQLDIDFSFGDSTSNPHAADDRRRDAEQFRAIGDEESDKDSGP